MLARPAPPNSPGHSRRTTTRKYGSGWPATIRWRRRTSSWTSSSPARPHRPHLLTLPGFPRTGRTHLSGHPDPEVRALAAADPTLSDSLVEDPDESVRRAAAANPSLTPEALEALLVDPRTAEGAAADPSLPVPHMRALLDRCLNGAGTSPPAGR
ncbi:hypothetical protein [Streptomyces sp. NPDC096339]|uniref:hypothetical protein n=1 Tax=Streptomyces sp. NPDC096339 TaxID=3366086 RepID=UPI00382FA317